MSDDTSRPVSEAVTLAVSATSSSAPQLYDHKEGKEEETPSIHSSSPSTAADLTTAVPSPRNEYSQSQIDFSKPTIAIPPRAVQARIKISSSKASEAAGESESEDEKDKQAKRKSSVLFTTTAPIPRPAKAASDPEKAGLEGVIDEEERDPDIVGWDGPDDPENPKNWPNRKKWAMTWVVSLFTLMRWVGFSFSFVG